MEGKILKEKLKSLDISMKDLAVKLSLSPQSLQNRLKAKEITLDFLIEIAKSINESVYFFIKGTQYEKDFIFPENLETLDKSKEEEEINPVIQAKNQTIEILEREVQDLRDDKDFLKKVIDTKLKG